MKREDFFAGFHVVVYEDFYREFFDFVEKSPEGAYVKKRIVQLLQQLSTTPVSILCKGDCFEKLSDYRDLYIIRIQTQTLNLRILFINAEDGRVHLAAFEEYAGKHASNYETYSPLAVKRTKPTPGGRK